MQQISQCLIQQSSELVSVPYGETAFISESSDTSRGSNILMFHIQQIVNFLRSGSPVQIFFDSQTDLSKKDLRKDNVVYFRDTILIPTLIKIFGGKRNRKIKVSDIEETPMGYIIKLEPPKYIRDVVENE